MNCEDTQAANKEVPLGEKQTAKGDQASEESIVPQGVMVGGVELKRIQRSSLDQIPDRSDCVDIRQYGSKYDQGPIPPLEIRRERESPPYQKVCC